MAQIPNDFLAPSTRNQRDPLNSVIEKYKNSSYAKAQLMIMAREWYMAYNSYVMPPKGREDERRARVSSPIIYSAVEHSVSKARAVLFPANQAEPMVKPIPIRIEDEPKVAPNEILMNWQLERIRIKLKTEMWLRNLFIFGFAAIVPYWRFETRITKVREPLIQYHPLTGAPITVGLGPYGPKEIIYFDGPDFDVIDIEDFYPDPSARILNESGLRWVIRRYYKSNQQVMSEAKYGLFDMNEAMKLDEMEVPPPKDDFQLTTQVLRDIYMPANRDARMNAGVVEILEYLSKDEIISVGNRRVVLRHIDNPYLHGELPVIVATKTPITNYPYGKGTIEPVVKSHAYVNALDNAALDYLKRVVRPKLLTKKNAGIDKNQLKDSSDFIELEDMEDIAPLQMPPLDQTIFSRIEYLRNDIDVANSKPGIARGEAPPPNVRSGSQQVQLQEAADERTMMDIDSFVETGALPLIRMMHKLNQQFITDPQVLRITGEEGANWVRVQPEEIDTELDWIWTVSARTMPKAVEAQQFQSWAQIIIPILQNPQGYSDLAIDAIRIMIQGAGFYDLAFKLKEIQKELARQRQAQGGIMQPLQGANEEQVQNQQGQAGQAGAGSAPSNSPTDLEGILDQTTQGQGNNQIQ